MQISDELESDARRVTSKVGRLTWMFLGITSPIRTSNLPSRPRTIRLTVLSFFVQNELWPSRGLQHVHRRVTTKVIRELKRNRSNGEIGDPSDKGWLIRVSRVASDDAAHKVDLLETGPGRDDGLWLRSVKSEFFPVVKVVGKVEGDGERIDVGKEIDTVGEGKGRVFFGVNGPASRIVDMVYVEVVEIGKRDDGKVSRGRKIGKRQLEGMNRGESEARILMAGDIREEERGREMEEIVKVSGFVEGRGDEFVEDETGP